MKEVESTTRPTSTKTTGKKKKSPSRIKRDRERRRLWRRKQRAARQDTVSDKPGSVVTVHQVSDSGSNTDQDSPSRAASGDLLEHSPSFDVDPDKSDLDTSDSTSVVDSGDDCEPIVPISSFPPDLCVNCGETEGRFFLCSRCKAVKYCNAKCQRESWSEHKYLCATLKDTREKGHFKLP